mmetsp:Transcript_71145/g.189914  ORF Transcript_71145/g.189914 Transcript_71145/m.189914 type:complete len:159 (+) Transcript_71145:39-515(+)
MKFVLLIGSVFLAQCTSLLTMRSHYDVMRADWRNRGVDRSQAAFCCFDASLNRGADTFHLRMRRPFGLTAGNFHSRRKTIVRSWKSKRHEETFEEMARDAAWQAGLTNTYLDNKLTESLNTAKVERALKKGQPRTLWDEFGLDMTEVKTSSIITFVSL